MAKKKSSGENLYVSTTIFAIVGTLVYWLIVRFLYGSYISWLNVVVFFIVVWIVYLWVTRRAYRRFERAKKKR